MTASGGRRYVLALDQGTSGSTALVVDPNGQVLARLYAEISQHYPRPGWVEHDPEEIWTTMGQAAASALAQARVNCAHRSSNLAATSPLT